MNAPTIRREGDRWQWRLAAVLSLASFAALALLLVLLGQAQSHGTSRVIVPPATVADGAVRCTCAAESARSPWLMTGIRVASCRICQGQSALTQTPAARGVGSLHDDAPTTASSHRVVVQPGSLRITAIVASVVLVWLLGLGVVLGPFDPLPRLAPGRRGLRTGH